jgi:hypothetical protein
MKKQILSLIAASLMLGNTPQASASPELFLSAIVAIAGAAHFRHARTQRTTQEQESLTNMFKGKVLPVKLEFFPASYVKTNNAYLALKTEQTNAGWMWQVFYLPHGFAPWTRLLQEPVVAAPKSERYDNYHKRFYAARADLVKRARLMAHDLRHGINLQ